jgi:UDP-N-acetylmuramate dehydrogenase
VPFWIIGGGTNTLFRDKGYRGLIIRNSTHNFRFDEKDDYIAAIFDAGTLMSEFLKKCMENGKIDMREITPFQGLPGTIGGAVYGNAGCFGQEIGNLVSEVEVLEKDQ